MKSYTYYTIMHNTKTIIPFRNLIYNPHFFMCIEISKSHKTKQLCEKLSSEAYIIYIK